MPACSPASWRARAFLPPPEKVLLLTKTQECEREKRIREARTTPKSLCDTDKSERDRSKRQHAEHIAYAELEVRELENAQPDQFGQRDAVLDLLRPQPT